MNMAIQHVQGCSYVLNKYAQHGYRVSIFKYEQHVILNKHIERLQPLGHI